jgi:uncharacterized membrane protein
MTMRIGRYMMGTLYVVAGIGHFIVTSAYMHIMPDYLPAHRELVLLSGAAEIAGGLGVMVPQTRRAAAWGLVVLLIVVMPANVWMAQHPERYANIPLWAIWLRLPLQVPLVWWAWMYTRRESLDTRESLERGGPSEEVVKIA